MFILAIILTYILEEKFSLDDFRNSVISKTREFISKLINPERITTQRKLRLLYLYICLPVITTDIVINLIFKNNYVISLIINIFIFIIFVNINSWKKNSNKTNAKQLFFISDFANNFFSASFWFIVFPYSSGLLAYYLITEISYVLKRNNIDSQVFNITIDKMLFYINFLPYLLLYFFISITSNFEDVFHILLEEKNKFNKSYYFILNLLYDVILVAIRKDNFKIEKNQLFDEDINDIYIHKIEYNDDVLTYIIALLNRVTIFFIGSMALIYVIRAF